jgi:hypothetical protein
VDIAKEKNWFEREIINGALSLFNEGPFIELSVDELLFTGYEDKMIKLMTKLCHQIPSICPDLKDIPERIGLFYGVFI